METTYHLSGVGVVVWRLAPPHLISPINRTQFNKFLLTSQNISPILLIERLFDKAIVPGGIIVEELDVIKEEIVNILKDVADYDLLDFVYKLLTHSV